MSKTLTFELPDEIHEAIREAAAVSGRPEDAVALEWLARYVPKPQTGLASRVPPELPPDQTPAPSRRLNLDRSPTPEHQPSPLVGTAIAGQGT